MEFTIIVRVDRKYYRMKVERIYQSDQLEKYLVTGGRRSITLQTNQPLFRNKGLKHRKGQWKLVSGDNIWNQHALNEIISTIQAYLDGPGKSPQK